MLRQSLEQKHEDIPHDVHDVCCDCYDGGLNGYFLRDDAHGDHRDDLRGCCDGAHDDRRDGVHDVRGDYYDATFNSLQFF